MSSLDLTAASAKLRALSVELAEMHQVTKSAFMAAPPMPGAPPMDPAMQQQAMPPGMDPAMMQQGMPPMPPGMDPSMMQGMPPGMDPAMMQGMDPSMGQAPPPDVLSQILETLETVVEKIQLQEGSIAQLTEDNEELRNTISEMSQQLSAVFQ